ncbi:MAG TPA: hypothetical protein VFG99_08965, partial [Chloroflexia bacterium]|nr:hypothetical protein [Chloroflexia bacterium]
MLVTYKPEGSPAEQHRSWEFDPGKVRSVRAEMIEKRYGQRYAVWVTNIQSGEARARRVLLWHLLNAEHPTLKLEDIPDFYMEEVEVDYALADLQRLRREIVESSMDDASKEGVLDRLDLEIATRLGK